jgi:RNA recognition motif-containing protein
MTVVIKADSVESFMEQLLSLKGISPQEFARFRSIAHPYNCAEPKRPVDPWSVHLVDLRPATRETTIRDAFETFGSVDNVHIMRDRTTSRSLGKAFVRFRSQEACAQCWRTQFLSVDGTEVRVLPAYKRE